MMECEQLLKLHFDTLSTQQKQQFAQLSGVHPLESAGKCDFQKRHGAILCAPYAAQFSDCKTASVSSGQRSHGRGNGGGFQGIP